MKTAFAAGLLLMLSLACGIPQEQFDALATDLQTAKAELSSAESKITELQDAATITASLVSSLERDISGMQGELEQREALLNTANSEIDTAARELGQRDQTIAQISGDLDAQRNDIADFRTQIADFEAKFADSVRAVEESKSAIADLHQDLVERDASLLASQQQAEGLGNDVSALEASLADLQTQAADLKALLDANSVEAVQAEIGQLVVERDALVAKVNQLATLTEAYILDPNVEIDTSGLACTGSMLPLLHCGDIVIMQTNLKHRDIQEDDIISFQRRDCFTGRTVTDATILHRVVDIDGGWFVTQGDNNYTVDSCRLPLNNVSGKLLAYIEDIYPEHYMETANYEAIKTDFNDLQARLDRAIVDYDEQVELLEDAENDFGDGKITYSKYSDVYDDTEEDRISLLELYDEANDLAATFFALQDLIVQRTYNDADWAHLAD